ncbi:hypothetical protein [Sphingomonas sp.]|uniref:hypothetical protein n=1 Tax=Sphingomonas sp. TaxID=28214 RepID=UPI00179BB243|nr:hypothetical protein [Sphingomonas sp.]MBA4763498.1 hypothetical protein [Sphingomonas sp.]
MFYSMGVSYGVNQERSNQQASAYAADAPKRVERDCAGLVGGPLAKCATEIVEAARESQRGESDLGAQWQAANWVVWATIVAGAQLLATVVGTVLLYQQIRLTREAVTDTGKATGAMVKANEIAQRGSDAQLRPYLFIDKIEAIDLDENDFLDYHFCVFFKNFGTTPARNIQVKFNVYCAASNTDIRPFSRRDRIVDAGVAAPGHHRRAFEPFYFGGEDRKRFYQGQGFIILRIRYSYTDDHGTEFNEAFDYFAAFADIERDTFYLLTEGHVKRMRHLQRSLPLQMPKGTKQRRSKRKGTANNDSRHREG